MPGFLFWNLHGVSTATSPNRPVELCAALTRLVQRHPLDVLVFTECDLPDDAMAAALNAGGVGKYTKPFSRSQRVQVWARLPPDDLIDRYNGAVSDRITIREVRFPHALPILVVGVHLRGRQTVGTESGRALASVGVADAVRYVEQQVGHSRTLLVGDLNMNPYEAGVVGANALHAVMTRVLARSVHRLKPRAEYPCFYNPMWACFGDQSPGPPGTLYYSNAEEPTNHFWHLYDQLLLRPELIDQFVRVEILDGDGVESFVREQGRPRQRVLSDHLPLYFEFDFTR